MLPGFADNSTDFAKIAPSTAAGTKPTPCPVCISKGVRDGLDLTACDIVFDT